MTAFLTGFEVECKISEIMLPDHYKLGFHSSGTVGTFGACAAAAKMLGLAGKKLGSAMGIAVSEAFEIFVSNVGGRVGYDGELVSDFMRAVLLSLHVVCFLAT